MARLSRNRIEEGTQAEQRRAVKNKISKQPQPTVKTGRHEAAKKALPLRRGKGR
jgi:hypothetical protein